MGEKIFKIFSPNKSHGRYNTHFIRFIIKSLTTVKRNPRPLFCHREEERREEEEELSILGRIMLMTIVMTVNKLMAL